MFFNRAVEDPSSVLTQIIESDENPYHLKTDYLESLGIKLPLTNWVTVTNVSLPLDLYI